MIVSSLEERGQKSLIKRAIRHAHSYQGGASYGTYGGYDISLLELETPLSGQRIKYACVPKPGFNDIQPGKLAGYGKYQRDFGNTCQTNQYGKMKYHYCETKGHGDQVCRKDPAPQNPVCAKFLAKTNVKLSRDLHEIMIIHKGRGGGYYPSFCFNRMNQEINNQSANHGWCKINGNYYDLNNPVEEEPGWGFCGNDCFLPLDEGPDKLRVQEAQAYVEFQFISNWKKFYHSGPSRISL